MAVITEVNELNINQMTQAQYDALVLAGTVEPDEIYLIIDGTSADDPLTGMEEAASYTTIVDTDTINTAFGKVKKFFADIATTIRATVVVSLTQPEKGFWINTDRPIYIPEDIPVCADLFTDYSPPSSI